MWSRSRFWERQISPPVPVLPRSPSPCHHHSHQGRAQALQLFYSHCHFPLQQLCFYFSPAKSPPDFAPCQEEPNTALDLLLFLFYCPGWADEIFSAHPPQIRGSFRRGQPGKSCLKPFQPCLPTFPCWRSGPCLPQFLCNTFAVIFP